MLNELTIINIRLSPYLLLSTDPESDPTVIPISDDVLKREIM